MADVFNSIPDNVPKPKEETKGKLPDQLQGKSAEEVAEILRQEHFKEVQRLKAENYDKEHSEEGKGDKANKSKTPQQPAQQQPSPPSNQGFSPQQQAQYQQQQKPRRSILTDPDGFMEEQFQQRLGPLVQSQVEASRSMARNYFKDKIGTDEWKEYGEEIENFVSGLSPQIQMRPEAYEQAYKIVQSMHLDEIVEKKATSTATQKLVEKLRSHGMSDEQIANFLDDDSESTPTQQEENSSIFASWTGVPQTERSTSSSAVGSAGGRKKQGPRLNDEQKRLAKQFDMTEEEYAEYYGLNTDLISQMAGGNG